LARKGQVFDFPSPSQRDGVQELESRIDLPVAAVRQLFDFELMQKKLPNFRFAHVFGRTPKKLDELARVQQVIASRSRACAIMETAHKATSW